MRTKYPEFERDPESFVRRVLDLSISWVARKIRVHVVGEASLTGTYVPDSAGKIYLPYVGDLRVVGKTYSEIAREIKRRLKKVIRDPDVSVQPGE